MDSSGIRLWCYLRAVPGPHCWMSFFRRTKNSYRGLDIWRKMPARPLPMVKDSFLFFTRDLLDHCRWIMTKHNLNRLLPYKVHQQALIRRNPPFDLNPIILYSQVAWFQDFFPRQFGAQRLLFGYLPSFHNWRLSNIKTKGCLVFLKVLYQIFQATHIWAVIALTSILSAGAHATRGNSTQLQSF